MVEDRPVPHWNGIVLAQTPQELEDRFRNPDGSLKKPSQIEADIREDAKPSEVVVSWEPGRHNRRGHVTIMGDNGKAVLMDNGAYDITELKDSREKDAEY